MKRLIPVMIMILILVISTITYGADIEETITVSTSAVAFSVPNVATYQKVVCTTETDEIRFWISRTNPTSTTGHLVASASTITLFATDIPKFKAIRVTTDATLQCSFYK
ncbi:MAG: hypothetical protein GY782_08495 [Gammaproteobacteria bacterium]|nr:hypothetical protein [Gammaproteobacteria bacterium]